MAASQLASSKVFNSVLASHGRLLSQITRFRQPQLTNTRSFYSNPDLRESQDSKKQASEAQEAETSTTPSSSSSSPSLASSFSHSSSPTTSDSLSGSSKAETQTFDSSTNLSDLSLPPGWEDDPDWNITQFSQLPHRTFGYNQHMRINEDFKECLRQMLWQFRAPIRYAFAYGSGVFSQAKPGSVLPPDSLSPHPHPPEAIVKWQKGGGKVIDFIFGVSHTQHWHSLNLTQHRDHYSMVGSLGSGFVSAVQDRWGAGVYFNPYITVNGTMIKYGVVNLSTLQQDLSQWNTLYLAGRLHKPVKILRDDPKVRLANQINLISAVRTSLLMLGPTFSETELYTKIASISYMGDPRMSVGGEDPHKVRNIVINQLPNFRQLYAPLVNDLPNVTWNDSRCKSRDWLIDPNCDCALAQDMDPIKRGNMVRRLPIAFRTRLYKEYQRKWQIPGRDFNKMMEESKDEDERGFKRRDCGAFEKRIAGESDVKDVVPKIIGDTVKGSSLSQSIKGLVTAGWSRSWKYIGEKRQKARRSGGEEQKSTEPKPKTKEDKSES